MMMHAKRIVAVLLSMVVAVSLAPAVQAESFENINKLYVPVTAENGFEGLAADGLDIRQAQARKQLDALKKASTPNTIIKVSSFSDTALRKIEIDADICGVLIVPSASNQVVISYIGVKDKSTFTLVTGTNASTLNVKLRGPKKQLQYISTLKDNQVNLMKVEVPSYITALNVSNETGVIQFEELPAQLTAATVNGAIGTFSDKSLKMDCNLTSTNGSLYVEHRNEIVGDISASTINGKVVLQSNTVSGDVKMSSINGTLLLDANTVQNATLNTINGTAEAKIAEIGKKLACDAINGTIEIYWKKQPANLSLRVSQQRNSSKVSLPSGWKSGYTVGNGKPELAVSVLNGTIDVALA